MDNMGVKKVSEKKQVEPTVTVKDRPLSFVKENEVGYQWGKRQERK
jgi:hypothetical protein